MIVMLTTFNPLDLLREAVILLPNVLAWVGLYT